MKSSVNQLAIFGGDPEFQEMLHVGRPNLGERQVFQDYVDQIYEAKWLTNNGPLVQELEQKIAEFLQVDHCILVCNATIGLEIASRALDLQGEVIVPSFTFIASAHALQWQGIRPVFCDVGDASHHIDPAQIERHITPNTRGILGVHVWGDACDTDGIAAVAEEYGLKVLYDAAHAFACEHQGRMIGNFGDAEVFSFHATKFFNTFEGGAITTNDAALADKLRFMRNFGFAGYDDVQHIGVNGKMTEIAAAMGLALLSSLDEIAARNRDNYLHYKACLEDVPGIELYAYDLSSRHNYQYIVVEIDKTVTGVSRDILTEVLKAENVFARRYFYPGCHMMEPYRSYYPHAGLLLPHTEALTERVFLLPSGTAISDADIERICALIALCVEHGVEVSAKYQGLLNRP